MGEDQQLFRQIAGGDEAAFRKLFHQYRCLLRPLQEAVDQLPAGCQQIYRLSRDENKRIPEIASFKKKCRGRKAPALYIAL